MGWLVAYLTSLILIPWVIAFLEMKEFLLVTRFWLLWPLSLAIWLPYITIRDYFNDILKSQAIDIKSNAKIGNDKFDRSDIVVIPEKDLKILLKAYRKKLIELEKNQVEIIRDELMHRTAENQLLR